MELIQTYATTLTHYSTEPLITGPDYDPLLLLLFLAGDVHLNPGPPRYPCSVFPKNVTSQGTGYLCTKLGKFKMFETLRIIVEPMAGSVPPVGRHARLPHRLVPHTISHKTFNILQWNANGTGNKQTELSIFLEAHNVNVMAIQESKFTAQSRSPNIQNYNLERQESTPRPRRRLTVFYQPVSLASYCQQRRRMTQTELPSSSN